MSQHFFSPHDVADIARHRIQVGAVRSGADAVVDLAVLDFADVVGDGRTRLPDDAVVDARFFTRVSNGAETIRLGTVGDLLRGASDGKLVSRLRVPRGGTVRGIGMVLTVKAPRGLFCADGMGKYIATSQRIGVRVLEGGEAEPEGYIRWWTVDRESIGGADLLPVCDEGGPEIHLAADGPTAEDVERDPALALSVLPGAFGVFVMAALAEDERCNSEDWDALKAHAAALCGAPGWEALLVAQEPFYEKARRAQVALARSLARLYPNHGAEGARAA